jgi:16S rRNA (cytidine1402-2'-O)-methyltransferase
MSSRPEYPQAEDDNSVADSARFADSASLLPGLYIVATPIGNLRDISLRALDTLAAAAVIACEDTRVTGKLLKAHGIRTRMIAYHEHNADVAGPRLLEAARSSVVALVSDAGTPLISDPGYQLVRQACAEHVPVTTIPGASSVMAALTLAALPTDRFLFAGFLPAKKSARQKTIAELAHIPATLVFFETSQRIMESLQDLLEGLGNRAATLTRELTKLYEEARRGTLQDLLSGVMENPPRGEIVLVIAPAAAAEKVTPADIDALLRDALQRLSVKDAVAEISSMTDAPKRDVYARALALTKSV